jgi:hypothetical protein
MSWPFSCAYRGFASVSPCLFIKDHSYIASAPIAIHKIAGDREAYLHHCLHLVTSQVGRQHIRRRSTSHPRVWLLLLLLLLLRLLRPVRMVLVRCLHILLSVLQTDYNTVCTSAATRQAGPGPTGGGRDAVLWLLCRACGLVCVCLGWC